MPSNFHPFARAHGWLVLAVATSSTLLAQTTTRVSVGAGGAQATARSYSPSISADGRFVLFSSDASKLVPADTNGRTDVFVRDVLTGQTSRIDVDSNGAQANNGASSGIASISSDGRRAVFGSSSTNLVPGLGAGTFDVFLHDSASGSTQLVSVNTSGQQGNSLSFWSCISGDGRCVAFVSDASDLVLGDTNAFRDVFVRDVLAATTERVSIDSTGAQANGSSTEPAVSADGRFVAFTSEASNLVGGDTNAAADVFVRDRQSGTTVRASVAANGAEGDAWSGRAALTADGRYVAFESWANNLVPGDTNVANDIFVRDNVSGAMTRIALVHLNTHDSGNPPSISGDGRFVSFNSRASTFVPGDTNALNDVFVYDQLAQTTTRVSVSSSGAQGNGESGAALDSTQGSGIWRGLTSPLAYNGSVIAFESDASNLVSSDTNLARDVFVHTLTTCSGIAYCTAGTSSNGCTATISATGSASVTAGSGFVLHVAGVEGLRQGLVFYGVSGPQTLTWSSGSSSVLCVRTPIQRTGAQNSGGTLGQCDGSFALDWNAFIATHPSALGNPFTQGAIVAAQAWYRDPAAAKTSNLSNALEFRVCP
jgi:Tol biopolymer transport system component